MWSGSEPAEQGRFPLRGLDHIRKMQDRNDRLQSAQTGLQLLSAGKPAAQRQAHLTAVAVQAFGHPSNQTGLASSSDSTTSENASGRRLCRRPAVFLDRDGTLNHDVGYVHRIADFRWFPGAVNAIRRLNESGYYVFIVTNQSGVAQGIYDETAIHDLHRWMGEELRAAGAHIDDMRYCPHHPHARIAAYRVVCSCRKPAAGMLLDLMSVWPVIREASIMVGDKESDAAAGRAAGIASAIVPAGSLEHFVGQLLSRREAACPPAALAPAVKK